MCNKNYGNLSKLTNTAKDSVDVYNNIRVLTWKKKIDKYKQSIQVKNT